MVKYYCFILLVLLLAAVSQAQVKCFARISLDRDRVYVQQPFKVTITVLTATWYTAPLDFDNIQIPNAFILSFDQTTPGMFTVGSDQYAGLQFYYIVFPYKAGDFTVPPINIIAETPAKGSSKSEKVTLKTSPHRFTVMPVPANHADKNWFVAKNVTVQERWNKPLQKLKVGDIIERTISVHASGTLPQFIPPLQKDSLGFASTYLRDADLHDERNEYDANGSLTQTVIYLLEKEGDFTIPEVNVTWWNPNTGKLYSRVASAGKVHVAANPNLGIVTTLRDSLNAKAPVAATGKVQKQGYKIAGIAWYWALLIALVVAYLLYLLVLFVIRLVRLYNAKRALYLAGEKHYFRKFMHSAVQLPVFIKSLYAWWDRFPISGKSSAVTMQFRRQEYPELNKELTAYLEAKYKDDVNDNAPAADAFKTAIKNYRNQNLHTPKPGNENVSVYQENWK
ncbi:MAG: BatD family protein [Chitinophagaceae bacterium]